MPGKRVGPWFRLVVKTVGLLGGFSYRQPFDRGGACATCGAGAVPVPPLVAELSRMGKKQLDRTAHDGHLVVSAALADAFTAEGLSGFDVRSVRPPHRDDPSGAYRWLHVAFEWPPMARTVGLTTDDLCPHCHRTGYFDADGRLEPWHYAAAPAGAADFGLTWERFGYWRSTGWEPGLRGVGGQGEVLISDRARAVLQRRKVRHVEYIPLAFEADVRPT